MSTDYQILIQKFNNFKTFIKSVTKNEQVIKDYEKMTDNEFMLFGLGFLIPNKKKLSNVVDQISIKVEVTDKLCKEKIQRYLECFIEYLEQLNKKEVLEQTVINVANEKGINLGEKVEKHKIVEL